MRKARLENNVVVEILEATPFPPFHPSLVWVRCGPEVKEGWEYVDNTFVDTTPPRTYVDDRMDNYPIIGDQLDAIWKAFDAIENGESLPKDTLDMLDKIKSIKNKWSK